MAQKKGIRECDIRGFVIRLTLSPVSLSESRSYSRSITKLSWRGRPDRARHGWEDISGAGLPTRKTSYGRWLDKKELPANVENCFVIVQFHESYGYEDFFEGIRPVLIDKDGKRILSNDTTTSIQNVAYQNVRGTFKELCERAQDNPDKRFVLLIDEINRGKTSRIFGELLYLLEYRDENEKIRLASGDEFWIPKNIFLIGTMNTADRSIALVDYALRRRFKFVTLRPYEKRGDNAEAPVLKGWLEKKRVTDAAEIVALFCELNKRVSEFNEHLTVGHSYFMLRDADIKPGSPYPDEALRDIWEFSIMPLLAEYEPGRRADELESATV